MDLGRSLTVRLTPSSTSQVGGRGTYKSRRSQVQALSSRSRRRQLGFQSPPTVSATPSSAGVTGARRVNHTTSATKRRLIDPPPERTWPVCCAAQKHRRQQTPKLNKNTSLRRSRDVGGCCCSVKEEEEEMSLRLHCNPSVL